MVPKCSRQLLACAATAGATKQRDFSAGGNCGNPHKRDTAGAQQLVQQHLLDSVSRAMLNASDNLMPGCCRKPQCCCALTVLPCTSALPYPVAQLAPLALPGKATDSQPYDDALLQSRGLLETRGFNVFLQLVDS